MNRSIMRLLPLVAILLALLTAACNTAERLSGRRRRRTWKFSTAKLDSQLRFR